VEGQALRSRSNRPATGAGANSDGTLGRQL